jgi:hypothetical protein
MRLQRHARRMSTPRRCPCSSVARIHMYTHTCKRKPTHTYIYIFIYTQTIVKNAPSKAREAYEHAKALPVQFNCKNCNVLLDRPRDAWSCNVCRVDNDWSAPKCVAPACADKTKTRPPQRVSLWTFHVVRVVCCSSFSCGIFRFCRPFRCVVCVICPGVRRDTFTTDFMSFRLFLFFC